MTPSAANNVSPVAVITHISVMEGKFMLDGLNKYGLPAKYGIVGFIVGILGSFIAQMLNVHGGDVSSYLTTMIATGIGGAIGGWIRQRRGMMS